MLVLVPSGSRNPGKPDTAGAIEGRFGGWAVFGEAFGAIVGMANALGGGNDGRCRGALRFNLVGLGGRESSPTELLRVLAVAVLISGCGTVSGSGSSWIVDEASSGVTFLVAEGVAGIFDANASVDASRSPRSIAGVLNPVMASGDALAGGAVFNRSWASLTEVGTLVNLIDPEADDVVESIEPLVRGLTLSSGPGELAHGEGSGFKGDIVETASETLMGMAKGDESPRLDTDIRRSRSVGSSERRRILGELQTEVLDISKGTADKLPYSSSLRRLDTQSQHGSRHRLPSLPDRPIPISQPPPSLEQQPTPRQQARRHAFPPYRSSTVAPSPSALFVLRGDRIHTVAPRSSVSLGRQQGFPGRRVELNRRTFRGRPR